MGITAKVDLSSNPVLALETATRRGMIEAGAAIIELSNKGAPTEPEPRHGTHMVDTAFVRAEVGPGGESLVVIGYEAFWAGWQHAHENWDHPHGGHAKFLELAIVEGEPLFLDIVAANMRAALA